MVEIKDDKGNVVTDHMKNKLHMGDRVACINGVGQYADVYIGEIVRVTSKTMFIMCKDIRYGRTHIEVKVAMDRPRRIIKLTNDNSR